MSWNCINCESANEDTEVNCEVCGCERYFSANEVNEFFESMQASPTDYKKVEANFKRASTINKKLRKENKALIEEMDELQTFYDTHSEQVQQLEQDVQQLKKQNLRLKIYLGFAGLGILFFILTKVSISLQF